MSIIKYEFNYFVEIIKKTVVITLRWDKNVMTLPYILYKISSDNIICLKSRDIYRALKCFYKLPMDSIIEKHFFTKGGN